MLAGRPRGRRGRMLPVPGRARADPDGARGVAPGRPHRAAPASRARHGAPRVLPARRVAAGAERVPAHRARAQRRGPPAGPDGAPVRPRRAPVDREHRPRGGRVARARALLPRARGRAVTAAVGLRAALPVLQPLSNSEKRCFQACPRKHHIRYELRVRPLRAADPLRFGTLLHAGLEAWWRTAAQGGDRLAAGHAALRASDAEPLELTKAAVLLDAYHARWSDEPLEVLDVEVTFETAIVNPETGAASRTYYLTGKIDALVRMPDGLVYICEHKTTSESIEGGADYWKRLRLDSQISDYFVGARALGHDVAGCLYDVIGKPKLQLLEATPEGSRKYTKDGRLYASQRAEAETLEEFRERLAAHVAEKPERYFQRTTVVRLEDDERDAAFDTWMTAESIHEAQRIGRHPRNPDACSRWGDVCEYFAVCTREADVDDPTRFRIAPRAHEELPPPPAFQ